MLGGDNGIFPHPPAPLLEDGGIRVITLQGGDLYCLLINEHSYIDIAYYY